MSAKKQFKALLEKLFNARTHWILSEIWQMSRGRPPELDKAIRDREIKALQDLACKALVDREYKEAFRGWPRYSWKIKGRGEDEKRNLLNEWYERKVNHEYCVYGFWGRGECLYVGSTTRGGNRPAEHLGKIRFRKATRVVVYPVTNSSEIPRLECLAVHKFNPKCNKRTPARKRWTKRCRICEMKKLIKGEVRSIFNLR